MMSEAHEQRASDLPGEGMRSSVARSRRTQWIVFMLILLAASVVALAVWTPSPCSHPSCAVQRFSVSVEIDALGHVEPIAFQVGDAENLRSLQEVLRGGGIEVSTSIDQLDLPYDPASGPLDRADLYQLVTAWRSRAPESKFDATLYALFTSGLISDSGEPLFGIMFDTSGREGFAVAPRTTERFFSAREPDAVPTLQLRTFIHELLHALNRHHHDAVVLEDGRLTLEAPTRCISDTAEREWGLLERPLLALSPDTIRFFQTGSRTEVMPGPNNAPFRSLRISPTECEDVRMRAVASVKPPLVATLLARLRDTFVAESAEAAQSESEAEPPIEVRLQAQPAAYPLGYPIAIRLQVKNLSEEPLALRGRLNPAYGIVTVEHRRRAATEWEVLQPLSYFETSSDERALLAPGEESEETIPIYFGEQGWTFPDPGEYAVRVRINAGINRNEVISSELELQVAAPRTTDDEAAIRPLLTNSGELDPMVGRLLTFGGRIGQPQQLSELEQITERYGHTAIGSALHLTLLSQRLRRPIDPATGSRPAPDFSDARELLEDTCTDSGIAALTSDLLEQRNEGMPDALRRRAETEASAWDGRTQDAERRTVATYSDPRLERWGPSVHFCFNEAILEPRLRREVSALARQLRTRNPAKVIVVGHGDQFGTCRFNDTLAAKRSHAIVNLLSAAGIPRSRIVAVSMGERRPIDFAADEAAYRLNRRVEILTEDAKPYVAEGTAPRQLLPECRS